MQTEKTVEPLPLSYTVASSPMWVGWFLDMCFQRGTSEIILHPPNERPRGVPNLGHHGATRMS